MSLLLDLLFPRQCLGCARFGSYFCHACTKLITQSELVCPYCERASVGGRTHPLCQKRFGLDGLWSFASYENPFRLAIHKLKYRFIRDLAGELVKMVITYWASAQPLFLEDLKSDQGQGWLVAPIPLARQRANWRGFNQAALLAENLAKLLGLKYSDCLIRTHFTQPQMALSEWQRQRNIKGVFVIKDQKAVLNQKILLIDDVWTTGATLKEAGTILKRAGAKVVWGVTLAR